MLASPEGLTRAEEEEEDGAHLPLPSLHPTKFGPLQKVMLQAKGKGEGEGKRREKLSWVGLTHPPNA